MNRNFFPISVRTWPVWLMMLFAGCTPRANPGAAGNPPNILFIITDQQYAGMMSCTGDPYLETPALDRLAASGMRFELAYSPNPVCIPSRTSMMTGYFPSAFGVTGNGDAGDAVIPDQVLDNTLGKLMQQAGYRCLYGGKTHWARGLDMESCGFEEFSRDTREQLAEACATFFKSKPEEPFFLVASLINPHDICYVEIDATIAHYGLPEFAPNAKVERQKIAEAVRLAEAAKAAGTYDKQCPPLKSNFELTENIPEIILARATQKPTGEPSPLHVYYYMNDYVRNYWTVEDWRMHHWIYHRLTEDVDRQIGTILNALRETGLDKNTIIVFTSDHGDMDGSHKMVHKGYFYEESTRVPFIVAGPGIARGIDRQHLISSSVDLLPTFCDFAGVDLPEGIQGRSIRPLTLRKAPSTWREYIISENGRGRMVRSAKYKYCQYKGGEPREMLIDMDQDPGEMRNLATLDQYRDVLEVHRGMLYEWTRKVDDKMAASYLIIPENQCLNPN
jgi:arylsulfatase A-like enzyme